MRRAGYLAPLLFLAGQAWADACTERHGAVKGIDNTISDHGYDLAYESLAFAAPDGKTVIKYCVKNNSPSWVKVKWMGPKPAILAEYTVVQTDTGVEIGRAFAGDLDDGARMFRYGRTSSYPYSASVKTLTQAALDMSDPAVVTVQASPLDTLGYTVLDALKDQNLLADYFEAYASSDNGGQQFETLSFANIWLPADFEELQSLSKDIETERGDQPLVPLFFAARSRLETTKFDNEWIAELALRPDALAQLQEAGILPELTVAVSSAPFAGLDAFEPEFVFGSGTFATRGAVLLASWTGETTALELDGAVALVDWSAVLQFQGVPIAGFSFQRFANE